MSDTYHVDTTAIDPFLRSIIAAAFPGYTGRKVKIETAYPNMSLRSYWDGGSRDYYTAVRLADLRAVEIPAQSPFDAPIKGIDQTTIPPGVVIVQHAIFCGKDMGITIHVLPADRDPRLLPPVSTATADQRFVLGCTAGLKSFARDEERHRFGMPRDVWAAAKAECIAAGWLNAAGAITAKGRNVIGSSRPEYGARWQRPAE